MSVGPGSFPFPISYLLTVAATVTLDGRSLENPCEIQRAAADGTAELVVTAPGHQTHPQPAADEAEETIFANIWFRVGGGFDQHQRLQQVGPANGQPQADEAPHGKPQKMARGAVERLDERVRLREALLFRAVEVDADDGDLAAARAHADRERRDVVVEGAVSAVGETRSSDVGRCEDPR